MQSSRKKQLIITIAVLVFGFAAIFALSGFLEKNRQPLPENFEDEDLTLHGSDIKGYVLGAEGLLADWYWMKSLQYIGDKVLNSKEDVSMENLAPLNPRLLYPYLNNATDLDSRFIGVYQYGAVVLPAIDKEQAIKFTEKGIADNPKNWRLYQHLGFIYWKLENYEKASDAYAKGAKLEGAPDFMRLTAAKMKSDGGSRATARAIYAQIFQDSQDINIKSDAALRLKVFDSLDEREVIQKVLNDFKLKFNRCANNWREITPLLQKEKLPNDRDFSVDAALNLVDPSGAPYVLDKENCTIKLDAEKTKIPLK